MSHTQTGADVTPHDQAHPVLDMVAQHGSPVQEGSNNATTATPPALALTMAQPAGLHDPAAMAAAASTGDTTLDFSVSPQKDEDAQMPGASRRRTASGRGHSRTPSDRSLRSTRRFS